MDLLTVVISSICSVLVSFGGSSLLFFTQNKRLKKAEADAKILENSMKLYEGVLKERDDYRKRLYESYEHRRKIADECNDLKVKNAEKDVIITKLEYCKCIINGCDRRTPPRNYDEE